MNVYKKWWCVVLVGFCIPVHAQPLTQTDMLLTDTDFALQELVEHDFDAIYFLPNNAHRALKVIRGMIAGAQKKIKAALFRLTEPSIAKALIDAHNKGVAVEVVVDPGALDTGYYSKVFDLVRAGVPVYKYVTSDLFPLSKEQKTVKAQYQTIMHLKVVSCDLGKKNLIALGSLNLTHAGFNGNAEVVEIRANTQLVRVFEDTFESLKRCSELLTLVDVPKKIKKKACLQQVHAPAVHRVAAETVPYIRRVTRFAR